MKNKKAPGGETLLGVITALFNSFLDQEQILRSWENAVLTLIPKKRDTTKPEKYQSVSLLM